MPPTHANSPASCARLVVPAMLHRSRTARRLCFFEVRGSGCAFCVGCVFEPACHKEELAASAYVRRVRLQASWRATAVAAYERLPLEEVRSALRKVQGGGAVKRDAGVGGVRADTRSGCAVAETKVVCEAPERRPGSLHRCACLAAGEQRC